MSYKKDENNEKKDNNHRKKREIEKKYGAKFSDHSDLPPDIEAEWLKNIEKFEEQFNQGKRTTLWEYLENCDLFEILVCQLGGCQ
ncbi:MAG: hypothetical protein ACQER7_13995 [Bacteroidota bacterium]